VRNLRNVAWQVVPPCGYVRGQRLACPLPNAVPDFTPIAGINLNEGFPLPSTTPPIGFMPPDVTLSGAVTKSSGARLVPTVARRLVSTHDVVAASETAWRQPMFSALDPFEERSPQPAGAEFWHLWTVIIPRLSITGGFVCGRVWRPHDGRRWKYRAITEYEDDR